MGRGGRFQGVNGWLWDETTNEGNIRLLSWGATSQLSISFGWEYQWCTKEYSEYLDPHLWLTFGDLCGRCDWNSCVLPPALVRSPPEINWFEDPFEKFSPMMLIEVLSTTLPHYHWSFQNIHRYSFHDLKSWWYVKSTLKAISMEKLNYTSFWDKFWMNVLYFGLYSKSWKTV